MNDKHPLLAKFSVYPARKSRWFFFRVFVWKRRSDMRKVLKNAGVPYKNTEAICCANRIYEVGKKGERCRLTGDLGQIHFYSGSFSMGVITHESGHAALAWCREKGVNPIAKDDTGNASHEEETFCWVLGNIARQIVLKTNEQWKFPGSNPRKVAKYE